MWIMSCICLKCYTCLSCIETMFVALFLAIFKHCDIRIINMLDAPKLWD